MIVADFIPIPPCALSSSALPLSDAAKAFSPAPPAPPPPPPCPGLPNALPPLLPYLIPVTPSNTGV